MIPFNKSINLEKSTEYVSECIITGKIAGDGKYTKLCSEWMKSRFNAKKILLTTSCTAALEMAAILLDVKSGDEVIMPSYTFVSTANAFVCRGAKIVFVDIRPDTMNIDEKQIEQAITDKTKAIVVVHYAGVGCEMDEIMKISRKHNVPVIEDAAQGVMAKYKDKYLGTIGDIGCYSFHETKNYQMGEGGAIVLNNEKYFERAEILREKGTDRSRFFRGEIDKYSWVDVGSSYLPSEINAAILWAQLEIADKINENRIETWDYYYNELKDIKELELPSVPRECKHNGHLFYIKVKDLDNRMIVISKLKELGISAVFHYVPLHSSLAGFKYGKFSGRDVYTSLESERLIRLPMFYGIPNQDREKVVNVLKTILSAK
ncbi:dTDP-4-amino-4,6-dideoxygalactose transaminase [Anaerocolumna sp. AGMB13025]|uniref:dTDP-4-amino-4,6-dideoxygalactose transaminase n=1 Tax=Anaerocolumna sp. AGMB13025 TaxID=3039116 RepID=UPI00241FB2D7|nr:dTDP-4-amino-4,6-dideoxygalactose transaminase [Anaerocolumna sp. AGMB13025]WFR56789.1 dTDP-4-amino-4,6-dideoxygalactose transaminase [Anaerocolumna sp. AGMB13025]